MIRFSQGNEINPFNQSTSSGGLETVWRRNASSSCEINAGVLYLHMIDCIKKWAIREEIKV